MSWKIVALGDVCKVIAGQSPESINYNKEGRGLAFYQGKKDFGDVYVNPPTVWTTEITKEAIKNDILMSVRAPVGPVNIATEHICIGRGLAAIRATERINQAYLFYYLLKIEKELVGNAGAVFNSINKTQIENLLVPLPSIPTQQKIVAKLDAIFAEIDTATAAAEANAKNAEALFQSYVTEVFETEKYNFKLVKFGTTASFVRGPFGGSLKKSIFVEKGYAVYEQQHAIYNQFSDIRYFIDESKFEEMKRFELKSGDLIMSCSGTMGKIAIVPENIEQGVINQALLKISPNKNVMGEYIARLLSSKYFQDTLTKLSGGAAIQNVPAVSVLKDIEVPIPSIKNQKLIVDIIDVLESNKIIIKNSYKCKSKEFTSLKQSILQRAFNGELVKD